MAFHAALLFLSGASALRVSAPRMSAEPTTVTKGGLVWSENFDPNALENFKGSVVPTASAPKAEERADSKLPAVVVSKLGDLSLNDPTTLPSDQQDLVLGTAAAGALLIFLLPLFENFFADLGLSSVIGGGLGGVLALRKDAPGEYARRLGSVAVVGRDKVRALDEQYGVSESISSKLPGGGGAGLSMDEIKKFGVAGTVAYILTELAFWVIAFPVASALLYQTQGHWPDLGDGADRAALLGFIFAGANVARLAVPLRFGVAFAVAPWVDENIVQPVQSKFGGNK